MKCGILGCGFACEEGLSERLKPWFDVADSKDLVFSFVSARFREYEELSINQDNSKTISEFNKLLKEKYIHFLNIPEKSMSECEARNLALKPLLDCGCDYIFILDLSDERYSQKNIESLLKYVDNNKLYVYYNVNFKNYVIDDKSWVDGFCPPRIYRVNVDKSKLSKFHEDNGCLYLDEFGYNADYRQFSGINIPKSCAFICHDSWNGTNAESKINYQLSRWGCCSYKFNKETNKVEINYDYYNKRNLPIPVINKDA